MLHVHSHLQPAVDESVVMDTTLQPGQLGSETSRNQPEKLEWLQDAGLGLFIHWSLDAQLGCVISHSLVGASQDYVERYYTELPKTLDESGWDFDHLARLARLAGFQYAVLTTKHHNGFCLWPTKTTAFHTERNLVKEYTDAFRRQGIRVGFYYSPEDFLFLRGEGLTITRTAMEPFAPEAMERYRALLRAQMTELLTEFGPVDVLFFDGGETMRAGDGKSLQEVCMELAWDLQPSTLITRGAIPTPEQQLPGVGADMAWEGCITLGTAWQYQPTNETYKTGAHVIRLLMDTRARGGSLLLNVGPDARGALPAVQENILREFALWHFINHEAVHETRPWIITNEGTTVLLRAKDQSAVYAVCFDMEGWDRGVRREVVLRSVQATDKTEVSVLGQSGELTEYRPDLDAHTEWEQQEDGLHISAMNAQRVYCGIQWRNPLVLKITQAVPAFEPLLVQTEKQGLKTAGGRATLQAHVLSLGSFTKAQLSFEYRVYPGFALSSYEDDFRRLCHSIEVTRPGLYDLELSGLEKGVTYQYRAVLQSDKNEMKGEMVLFVAE